LPQGLHKEFFMLQALAASPAALEAGLATLPSQPLATPLQIRDAAVALVERDQMHQAYSLVSEAVRTHSDSQELLSLAALICEAREDWARASAYLERLVRLQGSCVTAEVLCHWIRVLRCQGSVDRAAKLATNAQKIYPEYEMLRSEKETLDAILSARSGMAGG